MTVPAPEELERLVEYLRRARAVDYSIYKRTTLARRVGVRMAAVDASTVADYIDHLEVNPDEIGALFNAVLINVTNFFRDPPVWEHLTSVIVPDILESAPASTAIRVWCAGCSTGEEAYSLAWSSPTSWGSMRHASG